MARTNKGYSQNDVATILHITRQSVSKWERGLVYPDLDNLVRLSDIYKIPIDDLIKGSNEQSMVEKETNNLENNYEDSSLNKINVSKYQNVTQGLMLMILAIVSTLVAPLGILVPIYVIWRNTKYNILHKTIIVVSIIAIFISMVNCFVIINDNFPLSNRTTVYQIN